MLVILFNRTIIVPSAVFLIVEVAEFDLNGIFPLHDDPPGRSLSHTLDDVCGSDRFPVYPESQAIVEGHVPVTTPCCFSLDRRPGIGGYSRWFITKTRNCFITQLFCIIILNKVVLPAPFTPINSMLLPEGLLKTRQG